MIRLHHLVLMNLLTLRVTANRMQAVLHRSPDNLRHSTVSATGELNARLTSDISLFELASTRVDDNSISGVFCKTWIGTIVAPNMTWEEPHCRRCRCDLLDGSLCEGPVCNILYHPYLEINCEEWSDDDCCCLHSGCSHNGKRYAANDWFQLTPGDPCTLCKCDPSEGVPQCVEITCPKAKCVDPQTIPGECCPLCLTGFNCGLPDLPIPDNHSLVNPASIPESSFQVVSFHADAALRWNCTCANPGEKAVCFEVPANVTH